MLDHSGTPAIFMADSLYGVCEARNFVVGAGCSMTLHKTNTGVKPTVAYLQTVVFKVWIRVPDNKTTSLDAKARSAILLCSISYGTYRAMIESGRTKHKSRY